VSLGRSSLGRSGKTPRRASLQFHAGKRHCLAARKRVECAGEVAATRLGRVKASECVEQEPSLKLAGKAGHVDPQGLGIIRHSNMSKSLDYPTEGIVGRREVRCGIGQCGDIQP